MRPWRPYWRTNLLFVVGGLLLLPATVADLLGNDSTVLILVGAGLIAIALLADWLPPDWLDRVKSVDVRAGSAGLTVSQHDMRVLGSTVAESEGAELPPEAARIRVAAKAVTDGFVSGLLINFETRVISGEADPGASMSRVGGTMQPTHRHGFVLLVAAAGRRASTDGPVEIVGEVRGPKGYSDVIGADAVEGGERFQTNTFLYNAPPGSYRITWSVGPSSREMVPFKTDAFDVPAAVHLDHTANEFAWDRAALFTDAL